MILFVRVCEVFFQSIKVDVIKSSCDSFEHNCTATDVSKQLLPTFSLSKLEILSSISPKNALVSGTKALKQDLKVLLVTDLWLPVGKYPEQWFTLESASLLVCSYHWPTRRLPTRWLITVLWKTQNSSYSLISIIPTGLKKARRIAGYLMNYRSDCRSGITLWNIPHVLRQPKSTLVVFLCVCVFSFTWHYIQPHWHFTQNRPPA